MNDFASALGWLASLWRKEPIEKSGAIIIADMNFKERRRATFAGAVVTAATFDDLDASNAKRPYQLTYTFTPEMLMFESGSGAPVRSGLGMKQKSWSASNFRIKMGGLPCDRVSKVSGLSVTAEVVKEYQGSFRFPTRRLINATCGDLTLTVSGDDKTFTEWNKFATMTLQDGVTSQTEELTCVIEWLDPTLKNTLGTLTLQGCALKEFKLGAMETAAKDSPATCIAVFSVEQFSPEGIVHTHR